MPVSVAYIAPYFDLSLASARHASQSHSPASCLKISGMTKSLSLAGAEVTVISPIIFGPNESLFYKKTFGALDGACQVIYISSLSIPFLNLLWAVFAVVKEIIRLKPQMIVFYNFYIPTALSAFIARLLLGVPLILEYEDGHFADPERTPLAKAVHNVLEWFGNKLLSGAVLVVPTLGKRLINSNICVCRGIVSSLPERGNLTETPIVLYSGRFDTVRGIDLFLEAVQKVSNPVKFLVTGYGPLSNVVESQVEHMRERGVDITCLGYVDDESLRELMVSATILVNPQRTVNNFAKYSFPSKLCTYMATGAVVISSCIGDLEDFASDKVVLYRNDSSETLAACIDNVLNEPDRFSLYARNARFWVECNCTPIAVSRMLGKVLEVARQRK